MFFRASNKHNPPAFGRRVVPFGARAIAAHPLVWKHSHYTTALLAGAPILCRTNESPAASGPAGRPAVFSDAGLI